MPRLFRMYGKKRGQRRTGSQALGSVGEALFFGFFFLLGVAALVMLLGQVIIPEWRANNDFVQSEGTILQTRIESQGEQFRPAVEIQYLVGKEQRQAWCYDIVWAYTAGSDGQQAAEQQIAQFEIGQQIRCWYDWRRPDHVVVVRGINGWLWGLLLLPLAFIVIGGGGLIFTLLNWGKSLEHRVVTARRAAELLPLRELVQASKNFPNIPLDANITNSPGTRLKYRLPINLSHGWRLFAIVVACIFWNVMVAAFAVPLFRGGTPLWQRSLQAAVLLPFAAVGVALIYYFARLFRADARVGTTAMELSDLPLLPGQTYEALIVQTGHFKVRSLTVSLVCEEEASYLQGTDTRTEHRRVYQRQVYGRENFEIEPGMAFEERWPLPIPPGVMHSFKADHNEVQWKLLVKGLVQGWPEFERTFPIVVNPPPAGITTTPPRNFDKNVVNPSSTATGSLPRALNGSASKK